MSARPKRVENPQRILHDPRHFSDPPDEEFERPPRRKRLDDQRAMSMSQDSNPARQNLKSSRGRQSSIHRFYHVERTTSSRTKNSTRPQMDNLDYPRNRTSNSSRFDQIHSARVAAQSESNDSDASSSIMSSFAASIPGSRSLSLHLMIHGNLSAFDITVMKSELRFLDFDVVTSLQNYPSLIPCLIYEKETGGTKPRPNVYLNLLELEGTGIQFRKLTVQGHPYLQLDVQLGKGSFGTVFLIVCLKSLEIFTLKMIDMDGNPFSAEANILRMSKGNPYIVQAKHIEAKGTTLYIVMEWCHATSMRSVLKNVKDSAHAQLAEPVVSRLGRYVLYGLSFLHVHCNASHNDVKLANLLSDTTNVVRALLKLGDLGLAAQLWPGMTLFYSDGPVGTPGHIAPEFYNKDYPHSVKVDIWSFGVVLFEMTFGKKPIPGSNSEEIQANEAIATYEKIREWNREAMEARPISRELEEVFECCFRVDWSVRDGQEIQNTDPGAARPHASELLNMKFFEPVDEEALVAIEKSLTRSVHEKSSRLNNNVRERREIEQTRQNVFSSARWSGLIGNEMNEKRNGGGGLDMDGKEMDGNRENEDMDVDESEEPAPVQQNIGHGRQENGAMDVDYSEEMSGDRLGIGGQIEGNDSGLKIASADVAGTGSGTTELSGPFRAMQLNDTPDDAVVQKDKKKKKKKHASKSSKTAKKSPSKRKKRRMSNDGDEEMSSPKKKKRRLTEEEKAAKLARRVPVDEQVTLPPFEPDRQHDPNYRKARIRLVMSCYRTVDGRDQCTIAGCTHDSKPHKNTHLTVIHHLNSKHSGFPIEPVPCPVKSCDERFWRLGTWSGHVKRHNMCPFCLDAEHLDVPDKWRCPSKKGVQFRKKHDLGGFVEK